MGLDVFKGLVFDILENSYKDPSRKLGGGEVEDAKVALKRIQVDWSTIRMQMEEEIESKYRYLDPAKRNILLNRFKELAGALNLPEISREMSGQEKREKFMAHTAENIADHIVSEYENEEISFKSFLDGIDRAFGTPRSMPGAREKVQELGDLKTALKSLPERVSAILSGRYRNEDEKVRKMKAFSGAFQVLKRETRGLLSSLESGV